MKLTGIIAMANNRVIGKNNDLPWGRTYKEDLKFFKKKTLNSNVIMGRKTWEGMGCSFLSNRTVWVLTKSNSYGWTQTFSPTNNGITSIVERIADLPDELDYFVAGGLSVYTELMPKIQEFFITYIKKDYEGDTVIPEFEDQFPNKELIYEDSDLKITRIWK